MFAIDEAAIMVTSKPNKAVDEAVIVDASTPKTEPNLPTSGKSAEVFVTEVGKRLCPWLRPPRPRPRADSAFTALTTRTWSASSTTDTDNKRAVVVGRGWRATPISRPLLPRMFPARPPAVSLRCTKRFWVAHTYL